MVVVLSAQGDTSDELIEKQGRSAIIRQKGNDFISGEHIRCSMAMAVMGWVHIKLYPTGQQVGICIDNNYTHARVLEVDVKRMKKELMQANNIAAGFQGINEKGDITTLGRGGSDTTAVALAAALEADLCEIYTDVDGVYTADPRIVPNARKLKDITYDEMLELASLGARVLHNRSVELAKKYNVNMVVRSSMNNNNGTYVREVSELEKMMIKGVAYDKNVARVSIIGVRDIPGVAFKIFKLLADSNINVDIIIQSTGRR